MPIAMGRSPRSPAKKPRVTPLQGKLSNWHKEADGSLSRTLTSVEDDAAAVPAGA
jgi:hypothetical protein